MGNILEGMKFGVGVALILSLFSIVYAVGFHPSSEVLPGTFQGDYSFNGSLGIGTTSPEGVFNVEAGKNGSIHMRSDRTGIGVYGPSSGAVNGTVKIWYGDDGLNGGEGSFRVYQDYGGTKEVLRITNSSVGIGTTSPDAKLDIEGGNLDLNGNSIRNLNVTRKCVNSGSPGSRVRLNGGGDTISSLTFDDEKGQLIFVYGAADNYDVGGGNDYAWLYLMANDKRISGKVTADSDSDNNLFFGGSVFATYIGDGGANDTIELYKTCPGEDCISWTGTLCVYGI